MYETVLSAREVDLNEEIPSLKVMLTEELRMLCLFRTVGGLR
jgi:hypothetical protein